MTTIKQLSSFAVLNVNGGERVTFTYDVIDADTGDLISPNNKGSFYAVDKDLKNTIDAIREYINENKLADKEV